MSYATSLVLASAALRHTSNPVNEHSSSDIEDDVHPHQAEVAPSIGIITADIGKISVSVGQRTERAVRDGSLVLKSSAERVNPGLYVFLAGLAGGGLNAEVLDIGAGSISMSNTGGKHC